MEGRAKKEDGRWKVGVVWMGRCMYVQIWMDGGMKKGRKEGRR